MLFSRAKITLSLIGIALAASLVAVLPVQGLGSAQVPANDHGSYYPPSLPKPALGQSYTDPVFGTTVKRITNVSQQLPGVEAITPEYAQLSVFNRDDTYMMLRPTNGATLLYDGNGNFVADVSSPHGSVYEPRWSRLNPRWLYYHTRTGRRIYRYDVVARTHTLIADYRVAGAGKSRACSTILNFGGGQSDISDNERINILCDNRYVMVVNLVTGTDYGVADAQGGIDYVTLAMDGESYAVGYGASALNQRYRGMEQYSKSGNFMVQLLRTAPHLAMARETDGTPVVIVSTSNAPDQPAPPNFDWNGIAKISLDGTATRTLLLGLIEVAGNNLAVQHFAGRSGDGWVYVGNYRWPTQPSPSDWKGYDQEIFRIQLVHGQAHRDARVERLVHMRNSSTTYYTTSLFSVGITGRKLAFPTDWGNPGAGVDTYLMNVDGGVSDPSFVVLDGFGGIHLGGTAAPFPITTKYFGFDAAIDIEFATTGYYLLDSFGGVHRGAGAAVVNPSTPYFGFPAAADLEVAGSGVGVYVLDRFGGVHRGGDAPAMNPPTPYFGFSAAVDLELASAGYYVLDRFGGLHAGGGAPNMSPTPHYFGFDIARDFELAAGGGGYVVDGLGGIHRAGGAPSLGPGLQLRNDVVVDLEFNPGSGWYILDSFGTVHGGGGILNPANPTPYFGFNIARDLEFK